MKFYFVATSQNLSGNSVPYSEEIQYVLQHTCSSILKITFRRQQLYVSYNTKQILIPDLQYKLN